MLPLEVGKGALVVLDGMLPHMSRGNCSGRSRQAFTLHLVDGGAGYSRGNWLQRQWPATGFA